MGTNDTKKAADVLKSTNQSPVKASDVVDNVKNSASAVDLDSERKGMTKGEVIYVYEDEVIDNRTIVKHNQTVKKEYVDVNVNQIGVDLQNNIDVKYNKITEINRQGSLSVSREKILRNDEQLIVYTEEDSDRAASNSFARGITSVLALPGGLVSGNIRGRLAGAFKNRRAQSRHKNIGFLFYIDDVEFEVNNIRFESGDAKISANKEKGKDNVNTLTVLLAIRDGLFNDMFTNSTRKSLYNIVQSPDMHKIRVSYYVRDFSLYMLASKQHLLDLEISEALLRTFEVVAGKIINESGDADDKNLLSLLPIKTSSNFYIRMVFEYNDTQGGDMPNVRFSTDLGDKSPKDLSEKPANIGKVISEK